MTTKYVAKKTWHQIHIAPTPPLFHMKMYANLLYHLILFSLLLFARTEILLRLNLKNQSLKFCTVHNINELKKT